MRKITKQRLDKQLGKYKTSLIIDFILSYKKMETKLNEKYERLLSSSSAIKLLTQIEESEEKIVAALNVINATKELNKLTAPREHFATTTINELIKSRKEDIDQNNADVAYFQEEKSRLKKEIQKYQNAIEKNKGTVMKLEKSFASIGEKKEDITELKETFKIDYTPNELKNKGKELTKMEASLIKIKKFLGDIKTPEEIKQEKKKREERKESAEKNLKQRIHRSLIKDFGGDYIAELLKMKNKKEVTENVLYYLLDRADSECAYDLKKNIKWEYKRDLNELDETIWYIKVDVAEKEWIRNLDPSRLEAFLTKEDIEYKKNIDTDNDNRKSTQEEVKKLLSAWKKVDLDDILELYVIAEILPQDKKSDINRDKVKKHKNLSWRLREVKKWKWILKMIWTDTFVLSQQNINNNTNLLRT